MVAEFISAGREKRALLLSTDPRDNEHPRNGFEAMGKPVPWSRRQKAVEHCKDMGMEDMQWITHVVDCMAQALERDKPYEAMAAGCVFLDLTGTYRLMAVLLTD